jgi:guanylate kinase
MLDNKPFLGNLYVISAPSGAGKTSLVAALVKGLKGVHVSVSHTTRTARPGEHAGIHYHFISEDDFQRKIQENFFLEYAQVFEHFYGTARAWVEDQLKQGLDVILEIDWQGAARIALHMPHAIRVFILPPSLDALRARLEARRQDHADVIEQRLQGAKEEMGHYDASSYVIFNEVFEEALEDLKSIIRTHRIKTKVQKVRYAERLAQLINE